MSRDLGRRVKRLEQERTVDLPWHLPADEWTTEQLLIYLGEGADVSDERLREIAASGDQAEDAIVQHVEDKNMHPTWRAHAQRRAGVAPEQKTKAPDGR